MIYNSMRWIKYNLTIIFFLIIITNSFLDSGYEDKNILKIVKRNLVRREKEYLKTQPLSENLKNFIKRVKRNNKQRSKDSLKDHMYIYHEGNVIPLKQLKIRDTGVSNDGVVNNGNVLEGKFTVVPLIVPRENGTTPQLDETTCIDDNETATSNGTMNTTTPMPIEKVTDEYDMVPAEIVTKGELLGKVIKDVKDLINFEQKSRPQGEASLCNCSGDWDSFSGGLQIRISFAFSLFLNKVPKIYLFPLEPPRQGFLTEDKWNATGIAPFSSASMISFTLISSTSKKVATFTGECRICEGTESITGHWMLRRRSKNCKDREEANSFFSDVLWKDNVRKLQHEHLEEIMSTIEPLERR